jgi:hypothetical protein
VDDFRQKVSSIATQDVAMRLVLPGLGVGPNDQSIGLRTTKFCQQGLVSEEMYIVGLVEASLFEFHINTIQRACMITYCYLAYS